MHKCLTILHQNPKAMPLKFLSSIFILLIFFSCDPPVEVSCPAFLEKFRPLLSCEQGDTVVFENQNQERLYFVLEEITTSEAYTCTKDGFEYTGDCPCQNIISFRFREREKDIRLDAALWATGYETETDTIGMPFVSFGIYKPAWSHEQSVAYGHGVGYAPLRFGVRDTLLPQVEVGGRIYENVVATNLDTLIRQRLPELEIWRMLIVEGKGLLQFSDRKTGMVWSLVD